MVNLYDPQLPAEQIEKGFTGLQAIGAPAAQEQMQFQQRQAQGAQPTNLSPDMQKQIRAAMDSVHRGADPVETAIRMKLAMAGHIPHPAAGLPSDHPMAQAFSDAEAPPQGAPGQSGLSAANPGQPTAAPQAAGGTQGAPPPAGLSAAAPQPAGTEESPVVATPALAPMRAPLQPQPAPQEPPPLTNADVDFLMRGGLRAIEMESPLEKLQRAMLLAGQRTEGNLEVEGAKQGGRTALQTQKDTAAGKRQETGNTAKKNLQAQKDTAAWDRAVLKSRTALAVVDKHIASIKDPGLRDLPEFQEYKAAADKYRAATGMNAVVDPAGAEAARKDMEEKRTAFEKASEGRSFGGARSRTTTQGAGAIGPAGPGAVSPPAKKPPGPPQQQQIGFIGDKMMVRDEKGNWQPVE